MPSGVHLRLPVLGYFSSLPDGPGKEGNLLRRSLMGVCRPCRRVESILILEGRNINKNL